MLQVNDYQLNPVSNRTEFILYIELMPLLKETQLKTNFY